MKIKEHMSMIKEDLETAKKTALLKDHGFNISMPKDD